MSLPIAGDRASAAGRPDVMRGLPSHCAAAPRYCALKADCQVAISAGFSSFPFTHFIACDCSDESSSREVVVKSSRALTWVLRAGSSERRRHGHRLVSDCCSLLACLSDDPLLPPADRATLREHGSENRALQPDASCHFPLTRMSEFCLVNGKGKEFIIELVILYWLIPLRHPPSF